MTPNQNLVLARTYSGCKIVSVQIDHARELRGETGPTEFTPGHDGWEHTVDCDGKPVGTFTNLGQAIEAARSAVAGVQSGSPPGAVAPATVTTTENMTENVQ